MLDKLYILETISIYLANNSLTSMELGTYCYFAILTKEGTIQSDASCGKDIQQCKIGNDCHKAGISSFIEFINKIPRVKARINYG